MSTVANDFILYILCLSLYFEWRKLLLQIAGVNLGTIAIAELHNIATHGCGTA